MEEQENLVIFDGNLLAWACYYAHSTLQTSKGRPSGMFYGTLSSLSDYAKRFIDHDFKNFIVVFDGGHRYQTALYPEYKINRPPKPEEAKVQLKHLSIFLKALGVKVMKIPGVEADPLVNIILHHKAFQHFKKIVVVSNDGDYLQMISNRVNVYQGGKKDILWTEQYFQTQYPDIIPLQHAHLKAITGCRSDNVTGMKGIGPKKGYDLLVKSKGIQGVLSTVSEEHVDMIQANIPIVVLPTTTHGFFNALELEAFNNLLTKRPRNMDTAKKFYKAYDIKDPDIAPGLKLLQRCKL